MDNTGHAVCSLLTIVDSVAILKKKKFRRRNGSLQFPCPIYIKVVNTLRVVKKKLDFFLGTSSVFANVLNVSVFIVNVIHFSFYCTAVIVH